MRFKDLDNKVRGWRTIELHYDGGDIWVCIANCHFGSGAGVKEAILDALKSADNRRNGV